MLHIVLTASVYVGCMCVLLMHLFFSDQLSYPRSQENTATRASNETAVVTSSSAVAERPRDASCLSVYSVKYTDQFRAQFGFIFTDM